MKIFLFTALACMITFGSFAQEQEVKYSFKEIGWNISIPAKFHILSRDSFLRIEQKGKAAIEEATGVSSGNDHKKLFVVREGPADYMDATIVPFDTVADGDWHETNNLVRDVLTETFKKQMPQAGIDTVSSVFMKDGRQFSQFYIKLTLPNHRLMHLYMFSALIRGYDFGCTMMFIDEEKGRAFYEAWEKSRFMGQ